jgi:hypothetical protein
LAEGDPIAGDEILWRRATALDLNEDGTCKSQLWNTERVSVNRASLASLDAVAGVPGCVAVYQITVQAIRDAVPGANVFEERFDRETGEDLGVDHAVIVGVGSQKLARKLRDRAIKV